MRLTPISILILLLLILQSPAHAKTYYADLSIEIEPNGVTHLTGLTNHPLLETKTTNELTNKKGRVWTFNLSLPSEELFSEFIYEIILPPKASVNYIKTTGSFRLISRGDQIIIYCSGENKPLSAVVQYQIDETTSQDKNKTVFPAEYYYFGAILLIILLAAATYFFYLRRQKSRRNTKFEGSPYEETEYSVLSDRQKEILKVLQEAGKPVNQTLICEKLNLPKSSVSRNIDSLERMGFIKKTRNGMSTMISLTKK